MNARDAIPEGGKHLTLETSTARDGTHALENARGIWVGIDLLRDVVMPGLTGPRVAEITLSQRNARAKVV